MKLLAFETATEACSVALWIDGEVRERFELAPRRHAELSLPWADELLAQAGIAKSQLDAIAIGRGPGAFTGVRLAIAIGQGIALALDRPIVPVSTLAALAMQAAPALTPSTLWRTGEEARLRPADSRTGGSMSAEREARTPGEGDPGRANPHILAAIDARMNEVYLGRFELRDGEAIALGDEVLLPPDAVELPADGHDWLGVGSGFSALDGALAQRLGARLRGVDAAALPHAAAIARLAASAYARGEAVAPERAEPAYLRNNVALTLVEQQALRAGKT